MPDIEPAVYAAELDFRLERAVSGEEWKEILGRYVETLARLCAETGPCLIGHIKALALGAGDGCLRLSAVSASRPVEVDGELREETDEVHLTLNVIVYGLTWGRLDGLVRESGHGRIHGIVVEHAKGTAWDTCGHGPPHPPVD